LRRQVGHACQPPKLNLLMLSLYWDSPSRAVARKQQAIAKMPVPTENWFEVSPTQSKDCGTRGSLAFSVPAMNSPRQILPGLFLIGRAPNGALIANSCAGTSPTYRRTRWNCYSIAYQLSCNPLWLKAAAGSHVWPPPLSSNPVWRQAWLGVWRLLVYRWTPP
jgi:hypothetical protein